MATNLHPSLTGSSSSDDFVLKAGLAQMLKGGVIMDVTTPQQAAIAQKAGAVAVMALERIPSDIRKDGGVSRMSNPAMIQAIQRLKSIKPKETKIEKNGEKNGDETAEQKNGTPDYSAILEDDEEDEEERNFTEEGLYDEPLTIPIMAKARIGHFVECQVLESLNIDYIDESEVLTPADDQFHVDKHPFKMPFVCGCRNLGEALRRIKEGAAMIRTKGEAGTGDIVEAVKHIRTVNAEIARAQAALTAGGDLAISALAREIGCDVALLKQTAELGRLPVVNFAAGGVATPADAALMMQLGCDGVFVGSGIFKDAETPKHAFKRARAIVLATANYRNGEVLVRMSKKHGNAMKGISNAGLKPEEKMSGRGW
ncbi:Pyridoxal 5'-phosphate synthase subunit snz1 [Collariella sp. IMI 366227]|nr:Pyridoxal 5'-phosphate synthase subunit snz1 [Collariella sp. IMI 366227]